MIASARAAGHGASAILLATPSATSRNGSAIRTGQTASQMARLARTAPKCGLRATGTMHRVQTERHLPARFRSHPVRTLTFLAAQPVNKRSGVRIASLVPTARDLQVTRQTLPRVARNVKHRPEESWPSRAPPSKNSTSLGRFGRVATTACGSRSRLRKEVGETGLGDGFPATLPSRQMRQIGHMDNRTMTATA